MEIIFEEQIIDPHLRHEVKVLSFKSFFFLSFLLTGLRISFLNGLSFASLFRIVIRLLRKINFGFFKRSDVRIPREMGSYCSTASSKIVTANLPPSLLFSDFCGSVKQKNTIGNLLTRKFRSHYNHPLECNVRTMEVFVHLWCVNCLSMSKWQNLGRRKRNQLIRDFLNTLYCTSHAFDEIFLLLFTNSKSRSFILGNHEHQMASSNGLRDIVEDILKYSASASLKYGAEINGRKCLEGIVDYPLKSFSLCPCTKRPLYVAMYLSRPDIVQLLLKNGARIPYEDVCKCMEDLRHPLRNVMDVLKVTYESKIKNGDDFSQSINDRTAKNILSLKLILVDVSHHSVLWTNIWDILNILTESESRENIPSLKHIARTRIRDMMRKSAYFCHPHIWELLCLPQTLASYMNLEECSV